MVFVQTAVLAILVFVYLKIAGRAVRFALADPRRFPGLVWRTPESVFAIAVVVFFLLMAASTIGAPPGKIDSGSLQTSLALYTAIVLFVIGFLVFRNIDPVAAFGLRWHSWPIGLAASLAALVLVLPPIYGAQWLGYNLAGPATEPQPIVTFLLEHHDWRTRLTVVLVAVVAAPLTEELVFRGCLYGVIRQAAGRHAAIAVSAVLFALIHAHAPSIPGLILLAVALALLYEATGSLWAPVALHAAFNAFSIYGTLQWPELIK